VYKSQLGVVISFNSMKLVLFIRNCMLYFVSHMTALFCYLKVCYNMLICHMLTPSRKKRIYSILLLLSIQGLMEDTYVLLINCHFHLFQSSSTSFSCQYLLLFLKSSRSCVLLLTPFISIICPSMAT
jgi:hypothetical protein